jgi:hypothetical protein
MELMQISASFHRIFSTTWSITTESVTMATLELSKRLILAGGFAVAVAVAPAIAVFAGPSASVLACPGGEEEDQFTGVCVPHTVPNSSFSTIPGNPDIPAIDGVPCTGHDSGQCIGLAEESEDLGPQPVPHSTVSSSP